MGSQRYKAEAIASHYQVTEDESYRLAQLLESLQIGDDISDAIWFITENGDVTSALAELNRLCDRLRAGTSAVQQVFVNLKRVDGA